MDKQDDEKVAIGGAFALGMIVYILGYGLILATGEQVQNGVVKAVETTK